MRNVDFRPATWSKRKEKEEKRKTTPFSVNKMRSQVLYQAAQVHMMYLIDKGLKKSSSVPDG